MSIRLHDKIRMILEATPHKTQRGLAQRMGLNPAAVNRMLHGARKIMAEEIPVIESYLGVKLTPLEDDVEYLQNPHHGKKGFSDVPSVQAFAGESALARVPVYGLPLKTDGEEKNIIDWVPRHPAQFGVRDAFALYVVSDDMEPRYFRGELVYVHPHRPPTAAKDCVLVQKNGETIIRRIVSSSLGLLKAEQFNPKHQKDIAENDIVAAYAVVGRG